MTKAQSTWLHSKRIQRDNVHGTGCTLSAAIAANLTLGNNLFDSVKNAKVYVTHAIEESLSIGNGDRILGHFTKQIVNEIF